MGDYDDTALLSTVEPIPTWPASQRLPRLVPIGTAPSCLVSRLAGSPMFEDQCLTTMTSKNRDLSLTLHHPRTERCSTAIPLGRRLVRQKSRGRLRFTELRETHYI